MATRRPHAHVNHRLITPASVPPEGFAAVVQRGDRAVFAREPSRRVRAQFGLAVDSRDSFHGGKMVAPRPRCKDWRWRSARWPRRRLRGWPCFPPGFGLGGPGAARSLEG